MKIYKIKQYMIIINLVFIILILKIQNQVIYNIKDVLILNILIIL